MHKMNKYHRSSFQNIKRFKWKSAVLWISKWNWHIFTEIKNFNVNLVSEMVDCTLKSQSVWTKIQIHKPFGTMCFCTIWPILHCVNPSCCTTFNNIKYQYQSSTYSKIKFYAFRFGNLVAVVNAYGPVLRMACWSPRSRCSMRDVR